MIITYLRSSSYGSYSLCPMQYALDYVVGLKSEGNVKAARGNVVHKALELLAHRKLAMQNGKPSFTEDETNTVFNVETMTEEDCLMFGWNHYTTRDSHLDWEGQLEWSRELFYETLALNDGMWNPMNRDIVCPEQYFDLSIDEPWARYHFTTPSGRKLEGNLGIKGTVDLITRLDERTFEYLDWKTGMRLDWGTGEVKDYKKLREDPQLRMYHLALTRIYPEIKYFIMTIAFVQGGWVVKPTKKKAGIPNRMVVPLPFGPEDIPITLHMLQKRFETVRDCIIPKQRKSWRCGAFCYFGKNNQPGTDKTICEFMHGEMKAKGLNEVIKLYGDESKLNAYGDGGGRQNVT